MTFSCPVVINFGTEFTGRWRRARWCRLKCGPRARVDITASRIERKFLSHPRSTTSLLILNAGRLRGELHLRRDANP